MGNNSSALSSDSSVSTMIASRLPIYRGERDAFIPIDEGPWCPNDDSAVEEAMSSSDWPTPMQRAALGITKHQEASQQVDLSKSSSPTTPQQHNLSSKIAEFYPPTPPNDSFPSTEITNPSRKTGIFASNPPSIVSSSDSSSATNSTHDSSISCQDGLHTSSSRPMTFSPNQKTDLSLKTSTISIPVLSSQSTGRATSFNRTIASENVTKNEDKEVSNQSHYSHCEPQRTYSPDLSHLENKNAVKVSQFTSNIIASRAKSELQNKGLFDCWLTPFQSNNDIAFNFLSELCQSLKLRSEHISDDEYDYSLTDRRSSYATSDSNSLVSALSNTSRASLYTADEIHMADGNDPTHDSDMINRIRNYHVVTTASIPWMTGASVNPTLRAAHLCRRNRILEEKLVAGSKKHNLTTDENCDETDVAKNKDNCTAESDNASVFVSSESFCSSLDFSNHSYPQDHFCSNISPLGESDPLMISNDISCEQGLRSNINANQQQGKVTLVVPWLENENDRRLLYGSGDNSTSTTFTSQEEQEAYIRKWLSEEASMPDEAEKIDILFYPAKYHKFANSIFALSDVCNLIPENSSDVCILEEPEHLNWYRAPGSTPWTTKFCHVVGVVHTNLKAYAKNHAPSGFLGAALTPGVNSLAAQTYCHRVLKLSGALQDITLGRDVIDNVHGIREAFLKEGQRRRLSPTRRKTERKAYYFGQLLWAKGFDKLLELEAHYRHSTGEYFEIDVFGSGPDECEIERACKGDQACNTAKSDNILKWKGEDPLPVNFFGRSDHSMLIGDEYSVFINPSLTEVLCTATAEAVAMGKFVIVPSHPSNTFFEKFPNCLTYRNGREFVSLLKLALTNDPPRLSGNLAHLLSWEEATMRLVKASTITKRDAARRARIDKAKDSVMPEQI